MDNTINGRTPDEIKNGLGCCDTGNACRGFCPYDDTEHDIKNCTSKLARDALAYIQQLEAAAPKWISVKDDTPAHVVTPLLVYSYGHIQTADWSYDKWTGKWWFYVDGEYEPGVTHWMPLPEEPKEDARG